MDIRGTSIDAGGQADDQALLLLCEAVAAPPDVVLPAWWAARAAGTPVLARGSALLVASLLDRSVVLPSLGARRLARLTAALRLAEILAEDALCSGSSLQSPEDCERWLKLHLGCSDRERFSCLFLDVRHRVIAVEDLFAGTIDGATVHPRVVVTRALRLGAAAVIVAHNHPSGVCQPSDADKRITQRLREALALVEIRLLDHLIVGGGTVTSLARAGFC